MYTSLYKLCTLLVHISYVQVHNFFWEGMERCWWLLRDNLVFNLKWENKRVVSPSVWVKSKKDHFTEWFIGVQKPILCLTVMISPSQSSLLLIQAAQPIQVVFLYTKIFSARKVFLICWNATISYKILYIIVYKPLFCAAPYFLWVVAMTTCSFAYWYRAL